MLKWEVIAGAIAVAAAFWGRVRSVMEWFSGWVVVTKKTDDELGHLVLSFLESCAKRRPSRIASFTSMHTFVRPLERVCRVILEALHGGPTTFWRRGRPIWYSPKAVSADEMNSALNRYSYSFSFIRGTHDWEGLLLQAVDWEEEVRQGSSERVKAARVIYHYGTMTSSLNEDGVPRLRGSSRHEKPDSLTSATNGLKPLRWSFDDIQGNVVASSLDRLSLQPELLALVEELTFWHKSQSWYADHCIPWRRGYVFHGAPGTGKTSLTRAIGEALDMPIHVFDLPSMSNQDLRSAWRDMLSWTPCIALLEDLDGVFRGRESVASQGLMGGGLTFDCLLNTIDGVERTDGVLLVVTTNVLETLDQALVGRPGRIDRIVEFGPLDFDGRVKMARRILDDEVLAQRVAKEGLADSAAAFQERCFRIALERRFAEVDLSSVS